MLLLSSRLTMRGIRQYAAVGREMCLATDKAQTLDDLQKYLDISRIKAEYIVFKNPFVTKINGTQIRQVVDTVQELGIKKDELADEPVIFSTLPLTLRYRYKILNECGFNTITAKNLSKYLNLIRKKTITELRQSGLILPATNIEQRLSDTFTQWPISIRSIQVDEKKNSLHDLRMKILQRYLELVIDLPEHEFLVALNRYVRIRHRPLQCIDETLMLLQKNILMPNEKIRSNLFLIHSDPDQIKQMLYELRSIAGVDIKEILKMYPKLCTTNLQSILAMLNLFDEYGIREEAQIRCFAIFTLSAETVKERLERAKSIPEFQALLDNPRILRLIYSEKKALKRVEHLHKTNKKCLSLNILAGSSTHYKIYEKAHGDRTKGKDLLFGIAEVLGPKFTPRKVREVLKRHPFWTNVPLVHARLIYQRLAFTFSPNDIFENCPLLLYPWDKIQSLIGTFSYNNTINIRERTSESAILDHLDTIKLTKSQILSLTLYVLEKEHYFSGNGVWTDGKLNEIYTLDEEDSLWTSGSNRQQKL